MLALGYGIGYSVPEKGRCLISVLWRVGGFVLIGGFVVG